MKHTLVAALAAAGILMASGAQAAPAHTAADARFERIYKAEWQWRVGERLASDDDTRGKVRPELPHVDARSQAARLAYFGGVLRQLDALPQAGLSPAARLDYQVYRAQIAAFVEELRFREYEQPLNADSAFWTDVTYGARQGFATREEYANYLQQLASYPRYFGEQLDNMRAGLARGFTPARVTLAGRDASLASVVDAQPEDTVFYTPFKTMPASIPAAEQAQLRAQAVAAIRSQVQPAYACVLDFMRKEYMPGAREALAAERLPDGKAYYQSKIV